MFQYILASTVLYFCGTILAGTSDPTIEKCIQSLDKLIQHIPTLPKSTSSFYFPDWISDVQPHAKRCLGNQQKQRCITLQLNLENLGYPGKSQPTLTFINNLPDLESIVDYKVDDTNNNSITNSYSKYIRINNITHNNSNNIKYQNKLDQTSKTNGSYQSSNNGISNDNSNDNDDVIYRNKLIIIKMPANYSLNVVAHNYTGRLLLVTNSLVNYSSTESEFSLDVVYEDFNDMQDIEVYNWTNQNYPEYRVTSYWLVPPTNHIEIIFKRDPNISPYGRPYFGTRDQSSNLPLSDFLAWTQSKIISQYIKDDEDDHSLVATAFEYVNENNDLSEDGVGSRSCSGEEFGVSKEVVVATSMVAFMLGVLTMIGIWIIYNKTMCHSRMKSKQLPSLYTSPMMTTTFTTNSAANAAAATSASSSTSALRHPLLYNQHQRQPVNNSESPPYFLGQQAMLRTPDTSGDSTPCSTSPINICHPKKGKK
ncbi:hypothetical protein HELRODRAFT_173475 [Helobdella robusta]|uniref:CUB domain-containing protein n=1 Tax=Helobdella robusta TaxID=6412 RepID=T1F6V2_HELRO|nr:hypothetical protein HELRODRAFT_173475 [Helobdella robusta]ESO03772.1 hypothetical protein HELRODRAFT_173475 [Helobdella robusta]